MGSKKVLEKYFAHYAEKEIFFVDDFPREYLNVLIIPAFDEKFENIDEILCSIHEKNSLLILVVNSQINSCTEVKLSNELLINKIKTEFLCVWKTKNDEPISLHETKNCDLLLIDRSTKNRELPSKTGVGLARKIAADVAAKLISAGKIKTSWIHCTDADVILPKNYFSSTRRVKNCAAAIYPYIHRIKSGYDNNKNSMLLYDLSLHHYVIGLIFSRSDHAYHTIGSTISIDFIAYSAVRGFPPIESGEDFYILNKISKIGKIKNISCDPIIIDGRNSTRTPFGTGKSVEKISLMKNPEQNFLFYNPSIFEKLKIFLNYIDDPENKIFSKNKNVIISALHAEAEIIRTLEKIGALSAIEIAFNSTKNPDLRKKHFKLWFDNFRTLKFIHQMRELAYPSIPLKELIQQPLYQSLNLKELPTLEELLNQFKMLSTHLTNTIK